MQNNPDYDQWYLSQEMKQQPYITHAPNHNVYQERGYWRGDDTSIVNDSNEDKYEYSQPMSLVTFVGTIQVFKVTNPFGTPAQVCLLYSNLITTNSFFTIATDQNLQTNSFPSGVDFTPGITIYNAGVYNGAPYWIDFQQFVSVLTSDQGGTGLNIVLGFRRKREQIIPTNSNRYNELSQ
jgi:hypothetical protein